MTYLDIDTMRTEIQNIDTIEFEEQGDGGRGVMIVRRSGEQVAICVTLEESGDYEVLIDKEVVERFVKALQQAANI